MSKILNDKNKIASAAQDAGFAQRDSEVVGFNLAAGFTGTSALLSVESRGFLQLPCSVAKNTSDKFNLCFADCGSVVVIVRFIVYKEGGQVGYDDGLFCFTQVKQPKEREIQGTLGDCILDPTSTSDHVEQALCWTGVQRR